MSVDYRDKMTIITCGSCGQKIRIPTGKRIELTCPKCKRKSIIHISGNREEAINTIKKEDRGYAPIEASPIERPDNNIVIQETDNTSFMDSYGFKKAVILGFRLLIKSILR